MLASKSKPATALQDETVQSAGHDDRPTMRSVSPDYAEALATEARLNSDIALAEAKIQRLVQTERVMDLGGGIKIVTRGGINDGHIAYPSPPPTPEPADHDSRVVALLGRLTPQKVKREPPKPQFDAERTQVAALGEQLEVAREALRVLAPVLHRLRAEASVELRRQLKPHYTPVATRLCQAQAELANAIVEHDGFLADLRKQQVAFAQLRPCLTQGPSDVGDPVETIGIVLEWARIGGHFDGEIPKRSE